MSACGDQGNHNTKTLTVSREHHHPTICSLGHRLAQFGLCTFLLHTMQTGKHGTGPFFSHNCPQSFENMQYKPVFKNQVVNSQSGDREII